MPSRAGLRLATFSFKVEAFLSIQAGAVSLEQDSFSSDRYEESGKSKSEKGSWEY